MREGQRRGRVAAGRALDAPAPPRVWSFARRAVGLSGGNKKPRAPWRTHRALQAFLCVSSLLLSPLMVLLDPLEAAQGKIAGPDIHGNTLEKNMVP
mmetsp:Transcript_9774/g.30350  ORF Transcript_9774/g.30350 Transcript_9774/m.30350 type:complete len:96 (+) Transcript_9774:71-358(+)